MNLSEFLLARIAEDEAPTWTLMPYQCKPGCCAPAVWVGAQCRYCDPSPVYGGTVAAMTSSAEEHAEAIHQRSRVLAECEAKRRIVEELRSEVASWQTPEESEHGRVFRFLALPYADHPDYREAWRP